MAFDLGDPVPLTFTTKDATGALASVTTAVLTITLPDGTSVSPAVAAVSVGTYAPTTPYISVQSGMHRVSWVGSGANAQNYGDVFNVLAADPGFLISLADARAGLILSPGQTAKDEDLRAYIAAASPIMEDLVGPILRTARVDTYNGGTSQIMLTFAPLISVGSVIESYGTTYQRTLTLQNIFAGTVADAFGYTFEPQQGTVTRRAAGIAVPFVYGKRNIQITYVSGRATVGGNILLATRRLVTHLWRQDQQWARPGVPAEDMVVTPAGYAVPRAVVEMCRGDLRIPGFA